MKHILIAIMMMFAALAMPVQADTGFEGWERFSTFEAGLIAIDGGGTTSIVNECTIASPGLMVFQESHKITDESEFDDLNKLTDNRLALVDTLFEVGWRS